MRYRLRGYRAATAYLLSLLVTFLAGAASAGTLYVSPAGGHVPPFATWAEAATNIQAAIDAATDGDLVLVTNGVYDAGVAVESTASTNRILLRSGLSLCSVNGPGQTVIDGRNEMRCVYMEDRTRLAGFTLTRGFARYYMYLGDGGGVYAAGRAAISNCVVADCRGSRGGGLFATGSVEIANSQFLRNVVDEGDKGGGACLVNGGVISNGLFVGNRVVGGYYYTTYGGGAFVQNGAVVIGCTFVSNGCHGAGPYRSLSGAPGYGGGVYARSNCVIAACTVKDNSTTAGAAGYYSSMAFAPAIAYGGGICAVESLVTRCVVVSNRAVGGAGSSTYTDAPGRGCGIYVDGGRMVNCLTTCNGLTVTNVEGSGLFARNSAVYQCTVARNGDRAVFATNSVIRNTIAYFNSGVGFVDEGGNTIGNCCAPVPLQGIGNVTGNPLFVQSGEGNFRIATGSPCIDMGAALTNLVDDIDGRPRPLDGNGDGSPAWDMGAYEFVLGVADSDQDGLTDAQELDIHSCNPTLPDSDGDGMDDGDEVRAGCSPTDRVSVLTMDCVASQDEPSSDGFVVRWQSVAGKYYDLLRSTNLTDGFSVRGSGIPATPPLNTYTDTATRIAAACFYRVKIAE